MASSCLSMCFSPLQVRNLRRGGDGERIPGCSGVWEGVCGPSSSVEGRRGGDPDDLAVLFIIMAADSSSRWVQRGCLDRREDVGTNAALVRGHDRSPPARHVLVTSDLATSPLRKSRTSCSNGNTKTERIACLADLVATVPIRQCMSCGSIRLDSG